MMALILILKILLFLISITMQKPSTRIFGGRECKPEEFPSAVILAYYPFGNLLCGGVILDMCYVITAAHCISRPAKSYMVKAGDIYQDSEPSHSRQTRQIKFILIHPNYTSKTLKNDLAVLFLDKALEATSHVAKARFVTLESPKIGDKVIPVGWGETETGSTSRHCLATQSIVFNKVNCTMYSSRILRKDGAVQFGRETLIPDESQICAGDLNGKNFTGSGDSGGPIYMVDGPNIELVGLVSYADDEVPNVRVFTDIAYHRKWILEVIKAPEDQSKNTKFKPPVRGNRNAASQWKKFNNIEFLILQIVTLRTL